MAKGLAARETAPSANASKVSAASGYTSAGFASKSLPKSTPSSVSRCVRRCTTRGPPCGISCAISFVSRTAIPSSMSLKRVKRARPIRQSSAPVSAWRMGWT